MRCCAQNKCQNDIQFLFGTLHMYSVHAYIKLPKGQKVKQWTIVVVYGIELLIPPDTQAFQEVREVPSTAEGTAETSHST